METTVLKAGIAGWVLEGKVEFKEQKSWEITMKI